MVGGKRVRGRSESVHGKVEKDEPNKKSRKKSRVLLEVNLFQICSFIVFYGSLCFKFNENASCSPHVTFKIGNSTI